MPYAKRMSIGGILYLENEDEIKVINALDDTIKIASIKDFLV